MLLTSQLANAYERPFWREEIYQLLSHFKPERTADLPGSGVIPLLIEHDEHTLLITIQYRWLDQTLRVALAGTLLTNFIRCSHLDFFFYEVYILNTISQQGDYDAENICSRTRGGHSAVMFSNAGICHEL